MQTTQFPNYQLLDAQCRLERAGELAQALYVSMRAKREATLDAGAKAGAIDWPLYNAFDQAAYELAGLCGVLGVQLPPQEAK